MEEIGAKVASPIFIRQASFAAATTTTGLNNSSKSIHADDHEGFDHLRLKLGTHSGDAGKRVLSGSPGNATYPMCQVDDCKEDLSHAKDYHRRHKVCELHSKVSKALVSEQIQRFCQQCSRFHPLSEFDEGKRSCRRRLAGYNQRRRRKTQPEDHAFEWISLPGVRENDTMNDFINLLAVLTAAQVETPRFSPSCSEVLDRVLEDDLQETVFFEKRPREKETMKRIRYVELKMEKIEAFDKNKWEHNWPNISNSCSGSSSTKVNVDINDRKSKTTSSIDGEMSTTVCRRLTQPSYYNNGPTDPVAGSISMSSMMGPDDTVTRLLLLENRVSVARALLPSEVKLAMGIADADSYSEFRAFSASNTLWGRLKMIDLNENPSEQEKQLQARFEALRKAVEKGRHFYPSCCEVLGRFLDDDLDDIRIKVIEAFETDKARIHPIDSSLSSPSETDTILLERARKLLRGNNVFTMGLEEAMMVFNKVDKDGNSGTCSSPSSSSSMSSVNQVVVRKRKLC